MIIVIMPFIVTFFPLFEHPSCLRAHDQNCLVTGGASLHLFDRYSTNGSGQHRTVIGLIFSLIATTERQGNNLCLF
jgi:hypothetical protein